MNEVVYWTIVCLTCSAWLFIILPMVIHMCVFQATDAYYTAMFRAAKKNAVEMQEILKSRLEEMKDGYEARP